MTVKFQGGSSAAGLERSQSHSEKEEALPAASVHTKTESKPTDAPPFCTFQSSGFLNLLSVSIIFPATTRCFP